MSGSHYRGTRSAYSLSYIMMPPKYRRVDRFIRSLTYVALIVLGYLQLVSVPNAPINRLSEVLIRVAGGLLITLSAVALVGSFQRRLRVEYGVIWFIVGSIFIQLTALWPLSFSGNSARLLLSASWTVLFFFVLQRANRLGATSKLLYDLRVSELRSLEGIRQHEE